MPDVAASDEVDNVLGDVRGVVANALEILGDENQLESSKHDGRILHHVSKQLAKELIAQAIHLVVALQHAAGKIDIAADQRIQAIPHHAFRKLAHARKIDVRLYLWMAQNAHRRLGHPQVKPYVDLPRMSELAEGMVRDSLNSLVRGDIDLARSVLQRDDQVDRLRDQLFRELLTYMMENSAVVFAAFELILVAKNLERIGDHATNIAEDVIYFVAGRDVRHPALDRR